MENYRSLKIMDFACDRVSVCLCVFVNDELRLSVGKTGGGGGGAQITQQQYELIQY